MIPKEAIDLILEAEGIDQPSRWPGGASGITIGYGYDLGYERTFLDDWREHLSPQAIAALHAALGLKGRDARAIAHRFAAIRIAPAAALAVFEEHTLPKYEQQTLNVFPGLNQLPAAVLGALVSLVFNRGASMQDDPSRPHDHTRSEMREIRRLVDLAANSHAYAGHLDDCLDAIADQVESMKRLWVGKGLNGLLVRRDAEAALVRSAVNGDDAEGAAGNAAPA
jgi:GH24 family phage-related lysozyme (muramidase)